MENLMNMMKRAIAKIIKAYKRSMKHYGETMLNGRGYTCA